MLSRSAFTVFFTILGQARAVQDLRPDPTGLQNVLAQDKSAVAPETTGAVQNDARYFVRQASQPDTECAYVSGNALNPLTCAGVASYCGYRTDLGVMGCCQSYSRLTNGQFTLSSCTFFTSCYDSTATSLCTGLCSFNSLNGYCTDARYPYCMTYSVTDQQSLTSLACESAPGITTLLAYTATTTAALATSISNSDVALTAPTSATANSAGGGAAAPTTTIVVQESSGGRSIIGPAVGGALGGLAIILLAAFAFYWLSIKKKRDQQKAATEAAAANNAAGGNGPNAGAIGAGAGAGAATTAVGGGAYAANGYYNGTEVKNNATSPSLTAYNEVAPPVYQNQNQNPQMAEAYQRSDTVSPMPNGQRFSEMPGSPPATTYSGSTQNGVPRGYSEVEGSVISGPQSPTLTASGQGPMHSTGSPSVLSSSTDDPIRPPGASVTGGPTSGAPQTQTHSGLGYQAGPVGDHKPFHELE